MNVMDAAAAIAHEYPGGAKALGNRLGKSNLADEVNPNNAAKLGLVDSVRMQLLAHDYRVLFAMAAECGFIAIPMPSLDGVNTSCAVSVAKLAQEFAELMGEVATDLADSKIDDNELRTLELRVGQLVAAVQQLLKNAVTLNAESKHPCLRTAA